MPEKDNSVKAGVPDGSNQHWIPQFLLKGFGRKSQASRVYRLDKETGLISIERVDKVASKVGLLTEVDDLLLGGIENKAKDVIRRIRKGRLNLTEDDRAALDRMVLVMMLTDPYSGVKEANMRERVVEDVSRQVVETAWREGMPVDRQRIKASIMQAMPRGYVSIALMSEHPLTLLALQLMGLTVHDTKGPAVIGDSPVLVFRAIDDGAPSLLNAGSEVALPISSSKVLTYRWETAINYIARGPDFPTDALCRSRLLPPESQ